MADDHMEVPLVANFNGNPRVQWTPLLHERFVLAVTKLGGPYEAKPKAIKECMGAHGLTLRHIKSHLQKYRASFGARSKNDMTIDKQPESGNNVPSPHMLTTGDDISDHKVYDVSEVQTETNEIPSTTFAPCNIGGDEFHDVSKIQTGTEGIPSMMHVQDTGCYAFQDVSKVQTGTGEIPSIMSASCDIGGLASYGLSEIPIGTERIPYMFTDPNEIRLEDVYALPKMPIGTEEIPCQVPPPHTTGNHEVYEIYEHQTRTEEIAKAEKGCTHSFTNGRYQNDAGKQLEAYASVMDYPSNILSSSNWEPSPYTMWNHEVYNEPTTLLKAEGGITTTQMEEHQSYKYSLGHVFNDKYNETMGLHPQDVVSHLLEIPTTNMPMFHMLPTPNGMGCHESYDGLSVQREIERSVQQTNEVDMHVMVREDAHNKYMKSLMEMASNLLSSD